MFSFFILFLQFASSPTELRVDFNQNTRTIEGKLLVKNIQRRTNLYFTYPNKYKNKAPYYNDLTRFKLYPSHFNQGYLRINEIYYNQQKLNFSWVRINWIKRGAVKITIPPSLKLNGQLEIHFTTVIPEKFGLFGCIKGRCWLGAPWYPIPVPLIKGKYETTSPPLAWKHTVKVTANKNLRLFLEKPAKEKVETSGNTTFFPLVTGNNFKQYCFGKFCLYHYSPLHSFWNFFSGIKINQVITFLKQKTPIESTRKIWLLETPLRQNIALALQKNKIFLAHKIFQILPTQYMLDFHRQSLLKAVYELVFRQKLSSLENNKDLVWLPGLLARHRLGKRKNVTSFLSNFEFIPQIDVIIKNPRMEFSNSFFSGPGNKDLFRESVLKWNNNLPQGNRIYNKLLDLLGKVELEKFLKSYLKNNKPFRNYLSEYTSRDHSWFFKQWLGKYPEVNYFLKDLKKLKKHKGVYFYKLVVGKKAEKQIKEPVEIRVTTASGQQIDLQWFNSKNEQAFFFKTSSPVIKVRLDPENRLVEKQTCKDGKNSKYDNYHPSPPWRFIFSGLEALFNVTELATRIYMDGDFKPRHDLSRWLNILFFRDEITEFGLGISWLRYFGRNINNTRLAYHLDFGFQGSLTRPLKNNQDIRSIKSTAFIRYMWNTRRDFMLPTGGSWGFVKGAANIYFQDYNYEKNSQNYELFSLMCKYFNLPLDATLALYLGGGIKGGEFHDQIEVLTLTGPSYLQGYRSDEFYGKSMAFASAELRHLIVKNPDLTLLGIAHLTRVSGGIYFGAGGICGDEDHIFNKNCRLASSFGYGIRLHGKWFGLYEGLLNFKLAFPLHKHETTRNNYIFFISLEPKF